VYLKAIAEGGDGMTMREYEIRQMYREAKSKPEIINILADLNECTCGDIREYLSTIGEIKKGEIIPPTKEEVFRNAAVKIREMLTDKNITVAELSDRTGINQRAIRNYMCQVSIPPLENLVAISMVLNVTVDEIVKGA
jgi:DNA-binding Xre family transcriptional regulator